MSESSTIILLPFIFAFLIFMLRFYSRESASSMRNPSFMLGVLTVATAGGYLMLRITDNVPAYGTLAFGVIGLALLGTAIARMFVI
jgi:uncharacterized membrane protein